MSCCRENSPRGFAQVRDYDTFLIYYCEYRFHIFLMSYLQRCKCGV